MEVNVRLANEAHLLCTEPIGAPRRDRRLQKLGVVIETLAPHSRLRMISSRWRVPGDHHVPERRD